MIDIEKAKEVFKNYVKNYDKSNPRIALKIAHTYRVSEFAKIISTDLKLSNEDIVLAELIGILHDIGRFEQVKRYDTFKDRISVDHAKLGVEILKENNFIYKFCDEEKYHNIILKAIENHNKFRINEGLNEKELLHAKIIRDADKLDIFNLIRYEDFKILYKKSDITDEPISKKILEDFYNEKQTERIYLKTCMDEWLSSIAMIYDLNFDISFKILNEKDYINQIIDRTKTEEMEKIRIFANNYIKGRI